MSAPEPADSAGPAGGAGGRRPNLLVIMCDQLRATALRLYGDRQTRQPHLEALAASGVLYRRAFTPYPVCVPARVAFWTGRWPHLTGSFNNTNYLQPGETHLLQLLRGAGYATALVGKNHCFTEPDLARYFDTYYPVGHGGPAADGGDAEVAAAREWVRSGGGALGAAYGARISPFPVQKHGTWLIGEQADAFIRAPRDRPWCAWVSIPDPHTPYQVSQPYASRYPPQTLRLPPHEPPGYPGKPRRFRLLAEGMGAGEVTDEHLRFLLSIYYGMIAVIDDVVGRLLRALQETGQREETIVLFTADHGDYATEHRVVRKGAALYDATVRVPLIVSQPGRLPAGAVCEDLVSTLDALPSLTRLLDLPALPGRSGRPLPVVAGGAPQSMVFSETGLDGAPSGEPSGAPSGGQRDGATPRARAPWQGTARGRMKMARTRDWKYVHDPAGEHELYDLGADPYELTNLVERPEQRERVQDFRHALLDWCIESEDRLPVAQRTPDRGL